MLVWTLLVIPTAVVLIFLMWSSQEQLIRRTIGISFHPANGYISFVDPLSPFDPQLRAGDRVISFDGIPIASEVATVDSPARQIAAAIEAKTSFAVVVERDGQDLSQIVRVVPTSWIMVVLQLGVLVPAWAFWLVALALLLFFPRDQSGRLFLVLCLVWAVLVAAQVFLISPYQWVFNLAGCLTWFATLLLYHFHLHFPVRQKGRAWWILLGVGYAGAIVGVGVKLFVSPELADEAARNLSLVQGIALVLWFVAYSILAIVLLLLNYYRSRTQLVNRQIGLITLGGVVAFAPLVMFTIPTDMIYGYPILPYELANYFLILVPVTYLYALRKFQFARLERYANRTLALFLVLVILSAFYLVVNNALIRTWPALGNSLGANLLLVIGSVLLFTPLHHRMRNFVDRLFYGGWYDYSSVVGQVSHSLEQAQQGSSKWSTVLSETIQRAMRVKWVCLFLPNAVTGRLEITSISGEVDGEQHVASLVFEPDDDIVRWLKRVNQPQSQRDLRNALQGHSLTPDEQHLLSLRDTSLIIPIQSRDHSMALLVMGTKYGGELFYSEDLQIIDVVAHQASNMLQKEQLIRELEEKATENAWYRREISLTREQERKRIAQDLHDQIIQQLVGIKYQLSSQAYRPPKLDSARDDGADGSPLMQEINEIINDTRSICFALRPSTLDLGFIAGIRSLIGHLDQRHDMVVTLNVQGDRDIVIDEEVSLGLFRCTQEALTNCVKHARSASVNVDLLMGCDRIHLRIRDEGPGFQVPDKLGDFMKRDHFGLVGIRERIDALAGEFSVVSAPSKGTLIEFYASPRIVEKAPQMNSILVNGERYE